VHFQKEYQKRSKEVKGAHARIQGEGRP